MDQILFENHSTSQSGQQNISFNPNDSAFQSDNQPEFSLRDINIDSIKLDEEDPVELEDGEIDRTQLNYFKPLYKEIQPKKGDRFYNDFYACLKGINGEVPCRYKIMQNRLGKFFVPSSNLQQGQRYNKKIQPDYSHPSTYALSNAVMIFGVDYLSNKQIKQILQLPNHIKNIKRINMSNAVIFFNSISHLQQIIKPHLYDNESCSFFMPKQEEDQDINVEEDFSKKLPRKWYGLRPYEYRQELIFWFIRYLTNIEQGQLERMKQSNDFMQKYELSSKIWHKKTTELEEYRNYSLNSSKFQTIDRSRKDRSICLGSQPQKRQRSREKSRGVGSENFTRSRILSQLESKEPQNNILPNNEDLNESYVEPMSFVYTPKYSNQIDAILKKESNEIIMMMECMHVGGEESEKSQIGVANEPDNDMAIFSERFDKNGINDRLAFERKSRIAELTTLKPNQKFDYRAYAESILEAEEESRGKTLIQFIQID